jgi:transcriptional regulator with XRE-family HTH domain
MLLESDEKMNLSNLNYKPVKDTFEIGRILRQKRKSQGLTLEQVAQHCGLSIRFVSEVERGKPTAEFGKVLFLLGAVGVDLFANTRE